MNTSSSDVCVIGDGIIGLATAAALREWGVDVTCLERAQPGQGQSARRTRQFRHLHATPELIGLAVRARQGWLRSPPIRPSRIWPPRCPRGCSSHR
ncbi:MAG: FAD-dependent oxidoreductase [Solirubrobacteraceae bacterium]